ncbi:P-loop containing nucleoside triphosphate hydrolase protein [Fimicolochytrium jonesii]|uniref:P-loop containing nucleoside triphosphate hydrolase protein n=1 Tax=Fimicolochytrium jonesii TaxID=1396493 RepID=UPI0022FEA1C0|nr:P-loop containing nucleoside triphosphate hydrolase protein [Fimicolochytrium jonesii]KAI8819740.1 P-loop containing nucleoside triphosphate hydrolase protein [Fimicolochytrium jonesii]
MGACCSHQEEEEEPLLPPRTPVCRDRLVSKQPLVGFVANSIPARLPDTTATSAPVQSAAATAGVATTIARIPGLKPQPSVLTQTVRYDEVSHGHTSWLLASAPSNTPDGLRFIGLDTEFDGPLLGLVQLATNARCLLVVVGKPSKNTHRRRSPNKALDALFRDPAIRKTGCELTKDALLLFSNFGHILRGGIDLTHLYSPATLKSTNRDTKGLFTLFSEMYLPPGQPLRKDKATTTSRWVGVPLTEAQLCYGVLDAWVSYKVGTHDPSKIASAMVLDLTRIDPGLLNALADQNSAVLAIEDMQQKQYDSKFSTVILRQDGKYDVLNSQFRNKLQFKDVVLFHLASGQVLPGKVEHGKYGKTKTVKLDNQLTGVYVVKNITVVEQGGSRGADSFLREVWVKLVLHGQLDTSTVPFFATLFLSQKQPLGTAPPAYDVSGHDLNPSQTKAVNTMLSAQKPLSLIHGPPGTGKTFAITAAVAASISSAEHHFYVLTCQTNAATRNLAVTLLKRGVSDFRIVVSDNFFVEWHEDQYKKIRDRVIQSSETRSQNFDKLIGPRTVVLCSLSQLSNSNIINILQRRRVTHLVIDEASQICLANLQHVLTLYQGSLKRLTFVGDPKQLAPFGSEQHPAVESVFERLQSDVMLNIQYRMPCDLGAFISGTVYNDRLASHKKPREVCTVALIDVTDGTEQTSGTGFTVRSPTRDLHRRGAMLTLALIGV